MAAPLHCFTICSANYVPLAKTLFKSLAEADPDTRFTLFLADCAPSQEALEALPFETIEAEAIGIQNFSDMAFRYSIMGLNTAIKPFCFKYLMDRDPSVPVVYLDPDLLFLKPMHALRSGFAEGDELILTPHTLAPLDDGYDPDDRRLMQTGAYNLGFAALRSSPTTHNLLDWWADHMRTRCLSDLPGGLFVDQKFMDMAPAFVERTKILRDRGYNAAYWNLHERPITRSENGAWFAGDDPLVFFHFSGVDRSERSTVSRHQNRHGIDTVGPLADLLETYHCRLDEEDDQQWQECSYAYGAFTDGAPIADVMRQVYRRVHKTPVNGGFEDIFAFDPDLYCGPSEELTDQSGVPVSRLMYEAWNIRQDLQGAFNLRQASERKDFSAWFSDHAMADFNLPPSYADDLAYTRESQALQHLPVKPVHAAPDRYQRKRPSSVHMVGYFGTESGLGSAVRRQRDVFNAADIETTVQTLAPAGFINSRSKMADQKGDGAVLYLHVNADRTVGAIDQLGASALAGRYIIGYWAWELPRFPEEWQPAIDAVDEIWVPSTFTAEAIKARTDKPVHVIPHAVVASEGDVEAGRCSVGASDDCCLITTFFDIRSFMRRKNPMGVLQAFGQAFPNPDEANVRLLLKSHGPLDDPQARRFFLDAAQVPGVVVRHGAVTDAVIADLIAASDVVVSAHRSEGFGLSLAEAMAAGKAVAATSWSGNTDFMAPEVSVPIPYSLKPLAPGDYVHAEGQVWAEPDADALRDTLLTLVNDPAMRRRLGDAARSAVETQLSPEAIAPRVRERLDAIFSLMS